jgi:hypothetical protein
VEENGMGNYGSANSLLEFVDLMLPDLLEAKDTLETLAANYPGLDSDPLFYEPLQTITEILEELE